MPDGSPSVSGIGRNCVIEECQNKRCERKTGLIPVKLVAAAASINNFSEIVDGGCSRGESFAGVDATIYEERDLNDFYHEMSNLAATILRLMQKNLQDPGPFDAAGLEWSPSA